MYAIEEIIIIIIKYGSLKLCNGDLFLIICYIVYKYVRENIIIMWEITSHHVWIMPSGEDTIHRPTDR